MDAKPEPEAAPSVPGGPPGTRGEEYRDFLREPGGRPRPEVATFADRIVRSVLALALIVASSAARAEKVDQTTVLTNEVLDLYIYEPICGYRIDRDKLDIYLLGTHMFWGEPVSQSEIDDGRSREIELIGGNDFEKRKKCKSVSDNFGPLGHRVRGVAR